MVPSCSSAFRPRRVQQIVREYAEQAGVKATPHSFRHQGGSLFPTTVGFLFLHRRFHSREDV